MLDNIEKSEIKFDFHERLKNVAWIEFDGIRAYNTAYAGGEELRIVRIEDNPYKSAVSKVRPDRVEANDTVSNIDAQGNG